MRARPGGARGVGAKPAVAGSGDDVGAWAPVGPSGFFYDQRKVACAKE